MPIFLYGLWSYNKISLVLQIFRKQKYHFDLIYDWRFELHYTESSLYSFMKI